MINLVCAGSEASNFSVVLIFTVLFQFRVGICNEESCVACKICNGL